MAAPSAFTVPLAFLGHCSFSSSSSSYSGACGGEAVGAGVRAGNMITGIGVSHLLLTSGIVRPMARGRTDKVTSNKVKSNDQSPKGSLLFTRYFLLVII